MRDNHHDRMRWPRINGVSHTNPLQTLEYGPNVRPSPMIRLVTCDEIVENAPRYATLSHCWENRRDAESSQEEYTSSVETLAGSQISRGIFRILPRGSTSKHSGRTHDIWELGEYEISIVALYEQGIMAQTEFGKAMLDCTRVHRDKETAQWRGLIDELCHQVGWVS